MEQWENLVEAAKEYNADPDKFGHEAFADLIQHFTEEASPGELAKFAETIIGA
jgi:hypothetical protein